MIKIVDNFFKDPYAIRNVALINQSSFVDDPQARWPGMRIEMTHTPIMEYVTKRVRIETNSDVFLRAAYFQFIGRSWGFGTYHADHPDTFFSIIYLTPDPPSNSGTEVYQGITCPNPQCPVMAKAEKYEPTKRKFYRSNKTLIERFL